MNKKFREIPDPDFHKIFQSLPDLYFIMNLDFEILEGSDAYLKAALVTREEVVGHNIFEVFPDNPHDPNATGVKNLRALLQRVIDSKAIDSLAIQKYDIRRRGAKPQDEFEERYWSGCIAPLFGEDGEIKYLIARINDITELVQMKEEKLEQSELVKELHTRAGQMELEMYQISKKIQENSEKLRSSYTEVERKNQELEYLYDKLEKLNSLKTQFLANVSFDLRTPLTFILGPLEKLLSDNQLSTYQHELKMIEQNTHTLLKRVNDLLDVARLDAGKMEIAYADVDLAEIFKQTCSFFVPYAQEYQIEFIIESPTTLMAEIDSDKILRILINLLSNAFKFTSTKGVVHCSLTKHNENARIIISDNGPGISPKMRDAVFERFFQIEEYSTRRFGGLGLGLSIVKDFVNLHKGSIHIEESKEGGAAFIIDLPLKAPTEDVLKPQTQESFVFAKEVASQIVAELQTQQRSSKKYEIAPDQSQKPLILVVEDNVEMNQYICEILNDLYRSTSAFDGKEGLQYTLEQSPDLIICDIFMPKMNGIQLIHEIKRYEELRDIPIIIITAHADDDFHLEMLNIQVNDYLIKPFSPLELKIKVNNLISFKKIKDELRYRNSQLVNQEKIAALWNLTAGIAHEIKNPLNFVVNCAELSLEALPEVIEFLQKYCQNTPQEAQEKVINIVNALQANLVVVLRHGNRAAQVIQKMTEHALAKTESRKPTDFNAFIDEAITLSKKRLAEEFPNLEIEITTAYDPTVPLLLIDTSAILKVIYSILNNSYYSLNHKRKLLGPTFIPSIRISTRHANRHCELCIKDNGTGIPDHLKTRIFTPFFTTKPPSEGVGLGLSLSYNTIVHEHGGKIRFESTENGCEFIITLPL